MLNGKLKKEAVSNLEESIEKYNEVTKNVGDTSEKLHKERIILKEVLQNCYSIINDIRNAPESIKLEIKKIEYNLSEYESLVKVTMEKMSKENIKTGTGAVAGVAAGAAVTAMAPSVAMGIATTFGVASTGTAISALSGAAATNAALAWLGGGALAAGGGGIAAGNGLLLLAGPIGWGIAGASIAGGAFSVGRKNKKAAEELMEKTIQIKSESKKFEAINVRITNMLIETKKHIVNLPYEGRQFEGLNQSDYLQMTEETKLKFNRYVNHTKKAARHLNSIIGEDGRFRENKMELSN